MRAAILLSVMFTICGLAALFGVPAVYVMHRPIFGLAGLASALVMAVLPPLVVLGWRRYTRK
jgi:4-amino-4-deoxy-L-arabinose transferase-like glycosyltransferase